VKILLVGNYIPDGQHSMLGFSTLLEHGLRESGHDVRTLHPPVVFGRIGKLMPRAFKWFAYVDKLVLGPLFVRAAASNVDLMHICDHSNALYIPESKQVPYVVTCHDLLAVRGSLGEETDCPASSLGKRLQQWILRGLKRADYVACASTATWTDLCRLIPEQGSSEVVPLAMRYNLAPLTREECKERLRKMNGLNLNTPFVLHVGSSHPRKNREGLLRIFAQVRNQLNAQLVLAGKRLTPAQRDLARQLNVLDRIVETGPVTNDLLAALYGSALAFVFPSRFEGFGWPIVEAQSFGCPVVCSNRDPFPEVAGHGAITRNVEDEQGFA
jgi:glycosyltransferase involved in cell wall biosynthesis